MQEDEGSENSITSTLSTVLEDPDGEEEAEREYGFTHGEEGGEGDGREEEHEVGESGQAEEVTGREEGGERRTGDARNNSNQYGEFNNRGGISLGGNFNWWAPRKN
ncbi:hypothetical protein TWF506_003502 [Arthrobotrys conoides]|uniref:Uncharacterized protein n=1 Tax=Arthrobotrys conoides TaxID=74498 RepID=A0AAN8N414_9PEZI